MHPRVEIPDGSHTLVPEGGDEGADGDQRPEGPKATFPTKASPDLSLTYVFVFKLLNLSLLIYVHSTSGVELKP
jgi:hypothetical protein